MKLAVMVSVVLPQVAWCTTECILWPFQMGSRDNFSEGNSTVAWDVADNDGSRSTMQNATSVQADGKDDFRFQGDRHRGQSLSFFILRMLEKCVYAANRAFCTLLLSVLKLSSAVSYGCWGIACGLLWSLAMCVEKAVSFIWHSLWYLFSSAGHVTEAVASSLWCTFGTMRSSAEPCLLGHRLCLGGRPNVPCDVFGTSSSLCARLYFEHRLGWLGSKAVTCQMADRMEFMVPQKSLTTKQLSIQMLHMSPLNSDSCNCAWRLNCTFVHVCIMCAGRHAPEQRLPHVPNADSVCGTSLLILKPITPGSQ
eukprot:TRINITY_DN19540_c0_g1_i1.p1 TRINITY_DN19540_c0_g1~~TRINITY_DN19540_c0_g1_i1.p1  ORF type:complete len:309 (+),score=16.71 TRINITY_DN19540_c0_g1_i1:43-969(+)